jgi:hypothetical protein
MDHRFPANYWHKASVPTYLDDHRLVVVGGATAPLGCETIEHDSHEGVMTRVCTDPHVGDQCSSTAHGRLNRVRNALLEVQAQNPYPPASFMSDLPRTRERLVFIDVWLRSSIVFKVSPGRVIKHLLPCRQGYYM